MRCTSNSMPWGSRKKRVPANDEEIHRPPRGNEQQPEPRVEAVRDHLIEYDRQRRNDEDQWNDWITPDAIGRRVRRTRAEAKQSDRHEREEDPFSIDHAREEGVVGAGRDQQYGPRSLQQDGTVRRAMPWV